MVTFITRPILQQACQNIRHALSRAFPLLLLIYRGQLILAHKQGLRWRYTSFLPENPCLRWNTRLGRWFYPKRCLACAKWNRCSATPVDEAPWGADSLYLTIRRIFLVTYARARRWPATRGQGGGAVRGDGGAGVTVPGRPVPRVRGGVDGAGVRRCRGGAPADAAHHGHVGLRRAVAAPACAPRRRRRRCRAAGSHGDMHGVGGGGGAAVRAGLCGDGGGGRGGGQGRGGGSGGRAWGWRGRRSRRGVWAPAAPWPPLRQAPHLAARSGW